MKKTILSFFATLCLSTFVVQLNAQTQTFDVTTFTPPSAWVKDVKETSIQYSITEDAKGSYCFITIGKSNKSTGDAKKDFKTLWQKLITSSFKAPIPTDKEMQTEKRADSYTAVTAAKNFKFQDADNVVLLYTASNNNMVIPVMVIANSNNYEKEINAVVASLQFSKSTTITANTLKPNNTVKENFSNVTSTSAIPASMKGKYINGKGNCSIYSYLIPPSWKDITTANDEITLQKKLDWSTSTISFLPWVVSSGNLETDMNKMFFQVFEGWRPWDQNGFKGTEGYFQKGTTCQGFDYYMLNKGIQKDNGNDVLKMDGIVLLVQLENNVAIIAGSQSFQGVGAGEADYALNYLLYFLRFNGIAEKTNNIKQKMLGSWSTAGSNVGLSVTYYGTNTFDWGGATRFSVSHDANYDRVTTTTYGSSGNYSLDGNELTKKFKSNNNVTKDFIRFYSKRYENSPWKEKMGVYDINFNKGSIHGGVEYDKD